MLLRDENAILGALSNQRGGSAARTGRPDKNMSWTPSSWRDFPILQVPEYGDADKVKHVEETLSKKKPPLVFAGEVQNLRSQLAALRMAKGFCCKAVIAQRALLSFLQI